MKEGTHLLITDAREVLFKTAMAEAKENPLAAAFLGWLLGDNDLLLLMEEAAARAAVAKCGERSSRNVAVLGFACGVKVLKPRFETKFSSQMEWSMGKPNFTVGGEPCGVVADPLNFTGIVAGMESIGDNSLRQRLEKWSIGILSDAEGLIQEEGWRRDLLEILGHRVGAVRGATYRNNQPIWLAAALHRSEWSIPKEKSISEILKAAISEIAGVSDGFEAGLRLAAIRWAIQRAMDFDIAALTVTDVATVLHRVPTIFQRWTWEEKPRTSRPDAQARQWHVENEYHFQSLLYSILKPLIPALQEEQYLPPTGTYQPRADLCILALELLVEVKFWYRKKSVRELTEEIAADLTLYLRNDSPYRTVIVAIWDEGGRTEGQDELRRGLKGLSGLFDVVIVNRPSCMSESATSKSLVKKKAKT